MASLYDHSNRFPGRVLFVAAVFFFLCSLGILIETDVGDISLNSVSAILWTAVFFWSSLWLSQIELGNKPLWPYVAYFALLPPLVVVLAAVEVYDTTKILRNTTRYEYCSYVWLAGLTTTLIVRIWNWLPLHGFMQRKWDDWTKNLSDLSKQLVVWIGLLLVLSWTQRLYFSSIPIAISEHLFPFKNDLQGIISLAMLLLVVPFLLIRIFQTPMGVVISLAGYGLVLLFNKEIVGERWSFSFWEAFRDENFLVFIYVPLYLLLTLLHPLKIPKLQIDRQYYWRSAIVSFVLAAILFCWVNANYNLKVLTSWRFAERWRIAHEATQPGFTITLNSDGEGEDFEQWFDIELDASKNLIKNTIGNLPRLPGGITIRNATTFLDTSPISESNYSQVTFEGGELTLRQIEETKGRTGQSTNRSRRVTFFDNYKNVRISNDPEYRVSAPLHMVFQSSDYEISKSFVTALADANYHTITDLDWLRRGSINFVLDHEIDKEYWATFDSAFAGDSTLLQLWLGLDEDLQKFTDAHFASLKSIPAKHKFESLHVFTDFQNDADTLLSRDQIRLALGGSTWLTAISNNLEKERVITNDDFQLAWDVNIAASKRFRGINMLISELLADIRQGGEDLLKKYHWTFPLDEDAERNMGIFVPAEQSLIDYVCNKHTHYETVMLGFGKGASVSLLENDLRWWYDDSDDEFDDKTLSMKELGNLNNLKELYINESLDRLVDMDALASCPELELIHTGKYDSFADLNWVEKIPRLKSLKLEVGNLDEVDAPKIFRSWKSLETIYLIGIPTADLLDHLIQCPKLKRIVIEYEEANSLVVDESRLVLIAPNLINLNPVESHAPSIPNAFTRHRQTATEKVRIKYLTDD